MMLEAIGAGSGTVILDVPVGTGRFLPTYAERGSRVIGIDASADMLTEARKKAGGTVELHVGDITRLNLADDSVDVAVCIGLFYLLDEPTMKRALGEIMRVSRRHGIIGTYIDPRMSELGWAQRFYRLARQLVEPVRGRMTRPHSHRVWSDAIRGATLLQRQVVLTSRSGARHEVYLLEFPS